MQTDRVRLSQIAHVCICVRDLQKSACFYSEVFGMEVGPVNPPSERVQQCSVPGGGGMGDFGVVLKQGHPSGTEPSGIDHFSFEVPTLADVFEFYRRARKIGVQATEPRRYDGHWQTFIFDPDGYKVEVLTNDPSALQDVEDLNKEGCVAGQLAER